MNAFLLKAVENTQGLKPVRELVKKGADVNAVDLNGWTALHHAARGGYSKVVAFLVSEGADLGAKNNRGKTALDLARGDGTRRLLKEAMEKAKKNK